MTEKVTKLRKTDWEQAVEDLQAFNEDAPIKSFVFAFTYEDEDGEQIAFSHSQNDEQIKLLGLATFLQHFILQQSADMADEYLH